MMEPSTPFLPQIERLLARVESLQQIVSQLYGELQDLKASAKPAELSEALEAVPVAMTDGQSGSSLPLAVPLSDLTPPPVARERRSSPRRQANQVSIGISSALDDSPPFTGWVLDYSLGGLGLFVDKRIPIGAFLHVRPKDVAPTTHSKEVQVKNCQRYLDGWRLGCRLESELTVEDLHRFGLEA